MSLQVELFRGDDYVRYGELALLPLLRSYFERLIGEPLDGARFRLVFLPVDDPGVFPGKPSLVNLMSSYGYVQVFIVTRDKLLYRHPHPIREIIGPRLQRILLAREPEETHWGFGIKGEEMAEVTIIRPAPEMTYGAAARTSRRRAPLFEMEEVSEPDPPEATLSELGAGDPGDESPVAVVIAGSLYRDWVAATPFSEEVEEGGFLAGRVFRVPGGAGRFIVQVTAAITAERTGASMFNFTFSGESFLRVSERIEARGQRERLLGWYHTHLFAATDSLGLSSIDVALHTSTFRRPWQVAGLINITGEGRTLRFYRKDDAGGMTQAPYWTVP